MEELIAALHSLESAVRSLDSFWIALANLALPLALSIIIVVQSSRQNKRNIQLQTEQFRKDVILRRYESIFGIYLASGEVGKYQVQNRIFSTLQEGDASLAVTHSNELVKRYNALVREIDLARLLFGGTDDELIKLLERIKAKQSELCDHYYDYAKTQLKVVCDNAWDKVHRLYNDIPFGDISALRLNSEAYALFLQLTDSEALSTLKREFQESWDMLKYDVYDVRFAKYLRISEICYQEKPQKH